MDSLLEKTIQFVDVSFGKKIPHYERTLYWILQLKPDANEALQIAAYSHDIQRAFEREAIMQAVEQSADGFKDPTMLAAHQDGGADIMRKFLQGQTASSDLIETIAHLISRHELGGDDGQNLLKDADSISYFECNANNFVEKYAPQFGYAKVKAKLDWMYERITSAQAKTIAQPFYLNALQKLESFNK